MQINQSGIMADYCVIMTSHGARILTAHQDPKNDLTRHFAKMTSDDCGK